MSHRPSHKLNEKHTLSLPVLQNEIISIDLDCPHCQWSTRLLVSMTADGRVAVVGEGLCGHATETVTLHDDQPLFTLTFAENCSYAAIHDLPPPTADD